MNYLVKHTIKSKPLHAASYSPSLFAVLLLCVVVVVFYNVKLTVLKIVFDLIHIFSFVSS